MEREARTGVELAMNEEPLVLFDLDDVGVATLTFNRPERNNAWNPGIERGYRLQLQRVDADPEVRAIVVTGAGQSFCPGVDVGHLDSLVGHEPNFEGRTSPISPLGVRKPMIAAINGACAGVGLVHALACDIRFIAKGARVSTAFARRGLAAEHGVAYLLPRLIGVERALDLLLSGRTVEAEEAVRLGLASKLTDQGEVLIAAQTYARDLATKSSPIAMALAKHQVWTSLEQGLTESLRATYKAMRVALTGADFQEGLASYIEKRLPSFRGLGNDFRPEKITGASIDSAFATLTREGVADE